MSPGAVAVRWERADAPRPSGAEGAEESAREVETLLPLPPVAVEEPLLAVTSSCPPDVVLGEPFALVYTLSNYSDEAQDVEVLVADRLQIGSSKSVS